MDALKIFSVLFVFINFTSCDNILFLNGIASPSHHLWNKVLIRGLAEKGHNITMVSVDNDENPPPNIHYIYLEKTYSTIYDGQEGFSLLEMAEQTFVPAIFGVYEWCDACCYGALNSDGLDIILNYPDKFKFDLVIYDFTCGPCLLPLLVKFNYPPLVSVTAFSNPPYTHHLTGGQKFPAIVPHYVIDYPQVMTFSERIYNFILYTVDTVTRQYISMPKIDAKIRDRFNFDFPSLDELEQKTALMLVNSDNAIDYPEPLQPNVIQVGGLQIADSKKLPDDFLKFVESGSRGTVLMSLGTNMKSNMLDKETLENILKTFAALPDYNFIWKFESDIAKLPIKPSKNVFISKFLPQKDILAHPNTKAFITHSGLLSSQEAMWYGVPMIAIPFFCDQIRTANKMTRFGIAIQVDFRKIKVDTFKKSISTVLETPSYAENSKKISKLFQDKQQKPLDTAIWWIEYVLRNPTAPQFSPTSLKIGWFAANSYDVILTLIIAVNLIIFVIYKIYNTIKIFLSIKKAKKIKTK